MEIVIQRSDEPLSIFAEEFPDQGVYDHDEHFLVAYVGGEPAAQIGFRFDGVYWWLDNFGIRKDLRGKGLRDVMIRSAAHLAMELGILEFCQAVKKDNRVTFEMFLRDTNRFIPEHLQGQGGSTAKLLRDDASHIYVIRDLSRFKAFIESGDITPITFPYAVEV